MCIVTVFFVAPQVFTVKVDLMEMFGVCILQARRPRGTKAEDLDPFEGELARPML